MMNALLLAKIIPTDRVFVKFVVREWTNIKTQSTSRTISRAHGIVFTVPVKSHLQTTRGADRSANTTTDAHAPQHNDITNVIAWPFHLHRS